MLRTKKRTMINSKREKKHHIHSTHKVVIKVKIKLLLPLLFCFLCAGCTNDIKDSFHYVIGENSLDNILQEAENFRDQISDNVYYARSLDDIPAYSGTPYVVINNNVPNISLEECTTETFYELSGFDFLGRCGTAYGCFGQETIAEGERGEIGHVKPSGWQTIKYNGLIDGNYLYNRCHLLMWKMSGILDDERNLITGTRYLNIEGMLPFEDMMVDYIYRTSNHVMYKVTPVFTGNELVARGVHMQAVTVEDEGVGISYNVFCYNVQPGITIDYSTGNSWIATDNSELITDETIVESNNTYIVNINTYKFHLPSCESVNDIHLQNRQEIIVFSIFIISIFLFSSF